MKWINCNEMTIQTRTKSYVLHNISLKQIHRLPNGVEVESASVFQDNPAQVTTHRTPPWTALANWTLSASLSLQEQIHRILNIWNLENCEEFWKRDAPQHSQKRDPWSAVLNWIRFMNVVASIGEKLLPWRWGSEGAQKISTSFNSCTTCWFHLGSPILSYKKHILIYFYFWTCKKC